MSRDSSSSVMAVALPAEVKPAAQIAPHPPRTAPSPLRLRNERHVQRQGLARDGPEGGRRQLDFLYIYIVGNDWTKAGLNSFLSRARRVGATPLISCYHLLSDGRKKGYKGGEPEVVFRALKDKDLMRAYLEDTKRLFTVLSKHPAPVIYHSEADSWTFCSGGDGRHARRRPVPPPRSSRPRCRRRLPARTRSRDSPARFSASATATPAQRLPG